MVERDPRAYLNDILESCDRLLKNVEQTSLEQFRADITMQDAFARRFEIIGEASKKLPDTLREQYPSIEWRDAAGFRDVLAHDYFDIEIDRVYNTAKMDVPILREQIAQVLSDLQK